MSEEGAGYTGSDGQEATADQGHRSERAGGRPTDADEASSPSDEDAPGRDAPNAFPVEDPRHEAARTVQDAGRFASRWDAAVPQTDAAPGLVPLRGEMGAQAVRLGLVALVGIVAMTLSLIGLKPEERAPTAAAVRKPTVLPVVPAATAPSPERAAQRVKDFRALRDLRLGQQRWTFRRTVPEAPRAVCAQFAQAGWRVAGWSPSPLGEGGECTAEKIYKAAGDERSTRTFALLRGPDDAALREIRIKLNLHDDTRASEAAGDVAVLLADLFARWRWDGADELAARIAAREPFEKELSGTQVRFWREYGDVERLNLTLTLPRPEAFPNAAGLLPVSPAQKRVFQELTGSRSAMKVP